MTTAPLPTPAQVQELLGVLFDAFKVKPGAKLNEAGGGTAYAGVYVADDGAPSALCVCDFAFAAGTGAALSMLPPTAVKEAVQCKRLSDVMLDNLREVMNICARLVLREGSPHIRLHEVCPLVTLPPPAAIFLANAKTRADFGVELGRYGQGNLAVLI